MDPLNDKEGEWKYNTKDSGTYLCWGTTGGF